MWYDISTTMSHNCSLNMVTSMRGAGKTVNGLSKLLDLTLGKKSEIIYLRRRDADIEECKDQLLDDILYYNVLGLADKWEFDNYKDRIMARRKGSEDEWQTAIYLKSLNVSANRKGTPYPNVEHLLFDEFLVEDTSSGNYLPNEPKKLLAFLSTVFRHRKVSVFMFANMYSTENPYFNYFHIVPKPEAIFTKDRERGILIHKWVDNEFLEMSKETDINKLIKGTSYGEFMLFNKSIGDDTAFIQKPTGNLSYYFTLCVEDLEIGCWQSRAEGVYYFGKKISPSFSRYTTSSTLGDADYFLKNMRTAPFYKRVLKAIENTNVRFETSSIKEAVLSAFGYR